MKKVLGIAFVAALVVGGVTLANSAEAAGISGEWGPGNTYDDMSWWGNTGATPEPYPDPKGRSGYWWWPTAPASNTGDAELWGNRGIVYHTPWEKPQPKEEVPPPPAPEQPQVEQRVPIENRVLFDFDKSTIKPEAKPVLDNLVSELKEFPQDTVVVEGHTCNIGTDEYNEGLSDRRANAVVDYLVSNGIDRSRITAVGYGEAQPAVPNDSPANRALNRRAYFKTTVVQ